MKFFVFISILFHLQSSEAKVLQEGWYKIFLGNTHMGFFVQKYEFDDKSKQMKSSYYLRMNALGGNRSESLTALATQKLNPIAYQFTSKDGDVAKTIDVSIKKDLMEGTVTENGKVKKVSTKLQKGTFLSTFLVYLMLQNPSGIKKNSNFSYNAIAEEDATIYGGNAHVQDEEALSGHSTFKVLNNFKGDQWINAITPEGIMLTSKSPVLGMRIELATKSDATKGFPNSDKLLNAIFKSTPGDTFYQKYAKTVSQPNPAPLPKNPDPNIKEIAPPPESLSDTAPKETADTNKISDEKKQKLDQPNPKDPGLPAGVSIPPGKNITSTPVPDSR